MPNRILRDGILTSERVNELGSMEEVFYRRLMSVVDDHGRYYGNPSLIRAACFPLKLDKVSDSDIGKWLLVTEKAGLVRQYLAADGKRYLQLIDFGQRIQAKSKFPEPEGEPRKFTVIHGGQPGLTVENRLVEGVDGVGDEGVSHTKRRSPKTAIPADFGISDGVREWAKAKGFVRLDDHLEAFIGKATAKDYRYSDWDAAFKNAIREDWAKLNTPQNSTVDHGESPAARRKL